jgi:hypothetical protein
VAVSETQITDAERLDWIIREVMANGSFWLARYKFKGSVVYRCGIDPIGAREEITSPFVSGTPRDAIDALMTSAPTPSWPTVAPPWGKP